MNIRRSTLLAAPAAALAMALAATPVAAQDARDTHFDGFYIQGFGGLATRSSDGGENIRFDTDGDGKYDDNVLTSTGGNAFAPGFCNGVARGATPGAGCKRDKDGAEYGGRIGYDSRMGNFVVGALVEGSKAEARDGTSAFSTTPAAYAINRELDYAISARLRAGFTPGGGALFYATGGASWAKIDHDFATTNTANAFDPRKDNKGVWGWQAGGGTEIMLTDNLSLGLEYLYNRYRDNKYNVAVTQGTAPVTNPFILASSSTSLRPSDRNFDFHSLRATVGFQF